MPARSAPKRKPSVLKRARQTERRNLRNRMVKSKVKTCLKKVDDAIQAHDTANAGAAMNTAQKNILSAASKGVLHKNTAARMISRAQKRINAAQKAAQAA